MARLALILYAFGILSIGLSRDWQLRHEDNGAMHTTLALSHRQLGLARTRAHDLFFNPHTGQTMPYGHHPPATALVLAGAFTLTGSDAPAVARLTVIAFHIGSVLLLTALLAQFFEPGRAILGGLVMATIPMSGYFGRMVNYEPLCLFAILVQLCAYVRFKRTGRRRDLVWLSVGVVSGGLVDWPSFFFTAALAAVEGLDVLRRRSTGPGLIVALVTTAASVFVFDLWHLWYAGGAAIQSLLGVVSSNRPVWEQDFTLSRFLLGQIDTFRRYFTEAGLISVLLVGACLARPHLTTSRRLVDVANPGLLKRVLLASGAAAVGYVLAAPGWAMQHQYWQFYFLPVGVLSMILAWGLLQRAIVARPTGLLHVVRVICVLDVLVASAYWLHFRHTRVEAYAIQTTAAIRAAYLTPHGFKAPVAP